MRNRTRSIPDVGMDNADMHRASGAAREWKQKMTIMVPSSGQTDRLADEWIQDRDVFSPSAKKHAQKDMGQPCSRSSPQNIGVADRQLFDPVCPLLSVTIWTARPRVSSQARVHV